jgi:hypothetical protein
MKKEQDPASIFEQLSSIKNRYNMKKSMIDEADLITVVLNAAPKEYQAVLTNEQLRLADALSLEHLSVAMNAHWRNINKSIAQKSEGENEIVLSAFAGVCFVCNKRGHKAHECPDKKANSYRGPGGNPGGSGKFAGKCNNCGRMGHKFADCWQHEENKAKRPAGYRMAATPAAEQSHSTIDGHKNEIILCGMTFTDTPKMLTDPNIWIADSAATVHTSPHDFGMHDIVAAKASDAITVGNGQNEKANKVASITGIRCDKHGNELGQSTLTDVTHLPTGMFNLFSLTKMMKLGWTLGGDSKSVWLTKGEDTVIFDILIPTNKGMLLAMYFKRNTEIAGAMQDDHVTKMTIGQAHNMLGHADEASTRKTAKELNIEIVRGTMQPCEHCAVAKAKQNNVP